MAEQEQNPITTEANEVEIINIPTNTRRQVIKDAFKWAGIGAGWTGLFTAINVAGAAIQEPKVISKATEQEQEATKAIESGEKLQTKFFARDIVEASSRITSDTTVENLSLIISGWFAGTAVGGFLLRNHSKLFNSIVGSTTAVGGKTVDVASTLVFATKMNDPRFKEYNVGLYFNEVNPLFSPNPSPEEVITKSLFLIALIGLSSFRFPAFGRGYLGASPAILKNNLEVAHTIGTALELGDQVKSLIEQGRDANYIKNYLQHTGENQSQFKDIKTNTD